MIYQFINAQRVCYPIRILCAVLRVSARGSDAWRQRQPNPQRATADQQLRQHVGRVFRQSRQTSGSPRVSATLQAEGIACSRRRVARLMRQSGLVSCWRRTKRHIRTTDSDHTQPVEPNRLNHDLTASAPDQTWVGDSTGIWTVEGWLYLTALVGVFAPGRGLGAVRDTPRVAAALAMALQHRPPAPGLLHHPDRGSQYTSATDQALLAQHGTFRSMSRKADCWDNAVMERFFGTVKTEGVDRQCFATRIQAKTAICAYLEVLYNRQRCHAAIGDQTPVVFEQGSGTAALTTP